MTFPKALAQALDGTNPGVFTSQEAHCEGALFHSPQPLVLRRVALVPPEWAHVPDRVVLCGTCEANLRLFQHLLHVHGGKLAWPVRREVGNIIRALGLRSWQVYEQAMGASILDA